MSDVQDIPISIRAVEGSRPLTIEPRVLAHGMWHRPVFVTDCETGETREEWLPVPPMTVTFDGA